METIRSRRLPLHLIKPTIDGQRPGHPTSARPIADAALTLGPEDVPRSLYIHTPFCAHKCHYCDFYSIVDTQDRQAAFTARLIEELRAWSAVATEPMRTVFVGGGTPSLLRPALWRDLLAALHDVLDMSDIRAGGHETEFTVECNPDSVSPELMGLLREGGVTRVSMGAQSFDPGVLARLERTHRPERVAAALEEAAEAGIAHRSVDLIYAVPGQTEASWEADLRTALSLPIDHVSAYNLTYEPNTALTARLERGEFEPADEETEIAMFLLAQRLVAGSGMRRYEVSNYARPGAACRHNLAYWRQEPWLAAGPSASGHLAGHRWKNTPRLDTYLTVRDAGFAQAVEVETPDPARALAERLMTGLRLAEGVDGGAALEAARRLPGGAERRLLDAMLRHADAGRFAAWSAEGRWVLGESGILVADGVAADAIAAVLG